MNKNTKSNGNYSSSQKKPGKNTPNKKSTGKKKSPGRTRRSYKRKKQTKDMLFILVPLVLLVLLLTYVFLNRDEPNGSVYKNSSTIPVIDVAKWEETINWKKVKKSGIRHAVLKIGSGNHDGTGFNEDPLFKKNYKNALKEDIFCGVYFFSYAVTADEAKKEALYCLELLKKYDIKPSDLFFPVAFDIEYNKALRTGKRNCTDMTLAFCKTIEDAGYEPMIYSSASYLEHNLIYKEIKDYKIWVANYEAAGPAFGKPYVMWQYSEDGQVDGVNDLCDMNYWYTNYIEVQKLKIPKESLTLQKGSTVSLNVTIFPENATNKRLIYKSSNKNIVKVLDEQTGTIEAVGTGSVRITVQTPSGIKERIQIRVK